MSDALPENLQPYLHALLSAGYRDWTDNAEALAACEELAKLGFCTLYWDGPKCWRVYTVPEQRSKGHEELRRIAGTQKVGE